MEPMSPADHQLYWIREFTRRMWNMSPYSDDWYRTNRLRAQATKEYRKHKSLYLV